MRDAKLFLWRSAREDRFEELREMFLQKQCGVEKGHEHEQESRNDVPRDTVRQADALAGHGKAMVRDGFRMGSMVFDSGRLEQAVLDCAAR